MELADVYKLVDLYQNRKLDHRFRNAKDYISSPKLDGYRSYHLVYEYLDRILAHLIPVCV